MKRKWIMAGAAAIVTAGIILFAAGSGAAEVKTCLAARGVLAEYIELRGKVELNGLEKVYAKTSGTVVSIPVQAGETVENGSILATLDTTELDLAVEKAQEAYLAAKANYEDAKGAGKHRLEAARAAMRQAELQVKEMEIEYRKTKILTCSGGTVLEKYMDKGQVVQPGMLLYEVGDLKNAYIRVDVLTDDASGLDLGNVVEISGDALGDEKLSGKITYIAPQARSGMSSLGLEQQRLEVRVGFDNSRKLLKPGYGVDVKITVEERANALYIPEKALFETNDGDAVFVVSDGRIEIRQIKVGLENDDWIEAEEGIREGEPVVQDPGNSLKSGMRVKNK